MTLGGMRTLVAGILISGGGLAMAAQQPASNTNFTGVVTAMDAKDITGGRRKFEAGARTAWHSHDRGQLIYAEQGRIRTGRRGQAFKEYEKAEMVRELRAKGLLPPPKEHDHAH